MVLDIVMLYYIDGVVIAAQCTATFSRSNVPVGSCHYGMARPLGCGWGSRLLDMEVSSEYIE